MFDVKEDPHYRATLVPVSTYAIAAINSRLNVGFANFLFPEDKEIKISETWKIPLC